MHRFHARLGARGGRARLPRVARTDANSRDVVPAHANGCAAVTCCTSFPEWVGPRSRGYRCVDMGTARPQRPFDEYLPTVSGAAGTSLDRARLDFEGRRFLATAEPGLAYNPIRVYAGAAHGDAPTRARLAADELERLDAGERRWLVVGAPTGRGWVDHVLACAVERLVDGDVATVASQFGTGRSIASTRLLAPARASMTALLDELERRPSLDGASLVIFGESFGAWTLAGMVDRLVRARPASVGLVAVPGIARLPVDDRRIASLLAGGATVVRLDRSEDPVVAFPGASLAWRPDPAWRAADGRRWLPMLTLRRALRAIDSATRFDEPWRLRASAHDYRHELAAVAAELVGVPDDPRVEAVQAELDRRERDDSSWRRTYGPAPHAAWPGADA